MRCLAATVILFLSCLIGCGKNAAPNDNAKSPRIVTYAPSITELAFDMGLGDHVVGVTSWCILPPGENRPVVGDAGKPNGEALLSVRPDIIFYDINDSDFDAFRHLAPNVKIIRLRARTLAELQESVAAMGKAVGREDLSAALLNRMNVQLAEVADVVRGRPKPRVLFVLGTDHPAVPGGDRLESELLTIAGGVNAAAERNLSGWPTINREAVLEIQPDVLICQVNDQRDLEKARAYWTGLSGLKAAQTGRVYVTADRRLTIPGSGVGRTVRVLAGMIHPDAFEEAANP